MTLSPVERAAQTRRPMLSEPEIAELSQRYGTPLRRNYSIAADDYMRSYRFNPEADRRAEVVFAIRDPQNRIITHAKRNYPAQIYRLPSGGVNWDEPIEEALLREIDEETGLDVCIERFIGLITYHFFYQGEMATFASYLFLLRADFSQPLQPRDNEISEFRTLLPSQLIELGNDLRNLLGNRRVWGQWRALAIDLLQEHLAAQEATS